MTYAEIKQLANNLVYESDFWESKEEYMNSFSIIDTKDIKTFNFLYTIELNKKNKEKTLEELIPIFTNNTAIKFINADNKNKFIIFHPCTRSNYKYQLSWFDQYGAIMDEKYNTIEETIKGYLHYIRNYEISEVIAC